MNARVTEQQIAEACRGLGFALAGVCDVRPSARGAEYREWLRAGRHGLMAYLARNTSIRENPAELLPDARCAIMVGDLYHERSESRPGAEPGKGLIARYARGRDYHKVLKKRLHALCDALGAQHPGAAFRAFVDTAPVMEREIAQLAGLGWIGKNTLLIHPRLGSFFFLGGVLTTLDIPNNPSLVADHCGTCTRCIDACPTQAISPYSVDASRCISYLTIEHRAPIDPVFHEAMGSWLYGCDICQEVCPHNSPRAEHIDVGRLHEAYAPTRRELDLVEVLNWTEEDRRGALAGSAMTRATLEMLQRNALIVASNTLRSGCVEPLRSKLLEAITRATRDEARPALSALAAELLRRLAEA
ncbi:MAG: tRNA epoxyqueuosine(34) reductase QueG [Planctomycetes bacterium]|nr:tRNA epoxyqueuosine(34) reductase QueG [Planctomycetota bacterium]